MSGMCTVCEQPGCFSARHEEEMTRSPHSPPNGLDSHHAYFRSRSNGSQHIHLTEVHGYTLASSRPMHAVHLSLHRDEEFTMEDPHRWVDMSARDFETSDIINHLTVMHRVSLELRERSSRTALLTVHDRMKHKEWGRQYAPIGLAKMHEDWWNDQLLGKKVEHLVGDHDVDVRTVDGSIDAHTGKVGAEIGALHLRLHGVLHDRHPENFDIAQQVEDIRHALAHPSTEPHPHLRNDRIELTMPHTVTVILDMPEEDALSLQAMLDARTRNIANGFYADETTLLVDNGKTSMKLTADIRKVGSLPEVEDKPPLTRSVTKATRPVGGTVDAPIYERDTKRWVQWHPMAQRYLDVNPPACVGDTDGDGDCGLTACPKCGPERGTL